MFSKGFRAQVQQWTYVGARVSSRNRPLFKVEQLDYRMTSIVLLADVELTKSALPP